jgi:hypothetical protein
LRNFKKKFVYNFENFLKYSNNIEFGFLLHKIADLRSKCFIFLNILIGFEIFVKFNPLPELSLIINTQADFSDFFKPVQKVSKGKKLAKNGLKNVFFIHENWL